MFSAAPTLRDYQHETLDENAAGFFDLGVRRQLSVLPTGTGKTVIFAQLQRHARIKTWLERFDERARMTLVLAHRNELLEQAAEKISAANPELFVEIEKAERRASMFADVVVGSMQSMVGRLNRFDPSRYRIVIVDEAHHATSPSYLKVFEHFGVMPVADRGFDLSGRVVRGFADSDAESLTDPTKMLLGFTATPKRGDDVGLAHVFERIAFSRPMPWFIEHGYLARLRGMHVDTTVNLDNVATRNGDFVTSELAAAVNTPERNRQIIKGWLDVARERKTIGFACDIQHAHDLADVHRRDAGIVAVAISGETPVDERRRILRDYHDGAIQALWNCNVLTEGFDEPTVSCVVHARPTKSSLLYVQMTGRGTRLAAGKLDCLVLDCCDLSKRHSLITCADLVGLPPNFDPAGDDLLVAKSRLDALRAEHPRLDMTGAKSFAEIRVRVSEFDVWKIKPSPAAARRNLAWVPTSDDDSAFYLKYPVFEPSAEPDGKPTKREERLDVRINQLGQFDVTVDDVPIVPPIAQSVDAALAFAERWFATQRRDALTFVRTDARWRVEPATENQLKWLKRKRVPHDAETITKGEATRLLDIAFGK